MSNDESNWSSWVRKAEHDLLNIRNNVAAEQVPWDTVCFHAQQAAEKMLKAFLAFHGEQPRYTHDLLVLLEGCARFDPGLSELAMPCALLTPYAVEVRYPSVYEPGEEEARAVLQASQQVCSAMQSRFPPPVLPTAVPLSPDT